MQIDLYPAAHESSNPLADCLAWLRQQGFQPTHSLVQGSLLCNLSEQPVEAVLQAIQQWSAQRPGRQAQLDEWNLRNVQGKDSLLTITVHPSTKAKAAAASA